MDILSSSNNILPSGITEASVLDAVRASGYPLQSRVAQFLRERSRQDGAWFVEEEWSYLDEDTGVLRNLDIFCETPAYEVGLSTTVRPAAVMLIECKQSEMPYVFFGAELSHWTWSFPLFAGLSRHSCRIISDDDPATWSVPISECLGLSGEKLIVGAPRYSSTFAKCTRKGKELELSGAEPYQSLVLPLLKAVKDFRRIARPPRTAAYFDLYATIPLAVIDGPLLFVEGAGSGPVVNADWVRVLRHETFGKRRRHFDERVLAIDVVHASFLGKYLDDCVSPFARLFGERTLKHQEELASGKGFAPGMGRNCWTDIEGRLVARGSKSDVRRAAMITRRMAGWIFGRERVR